MTEAPDFQHHVNLAVAHSCNHGLQEKVTEGSEVQDHPLHRVLVQTGLCEDFFFKFLFVFVKKIMGTVEFAISGLAQVTGSEIWWPCYVPRYINLITLPLPTASGTLLSGFYPLEQSGAG